MSQGSLLPRGIRNNNPGNIRWSYHNNWHGTADVDDKGFVIFKQPYHGLRAMRVLLINYHLHAGCNYISEFVSRWAPSSENDTQAYIDAVSKSMKHPVAEPLQIPEDLPALMKAIIVQENGVCPYSDKELFMTQVYYPIMS